MAQDGTLGETPLEPKASEAGFFGRAKAEFRLAEHTVVFLRNLSIVGVLGTVIGSYFQYVSWREEQNIARYKQDFEAGTAAFADASTVLSTAMNLQQIVYYTFKQAVQDGVDAAEDAFLTKSGRDAYQSYLQARTSLRENIDVLARKMEIYIDWPSDRDRDPAQVKLLGDDPIDRHGLGDYDFDCDRYLPDATSIDTLKIDVVPKPDRQPLQVNWWSAKHHVVTFHYCLEIAHGAILAARQWASRSVVDASEKARMVQDADKIETMLNKQVGRLSAFMALAMWRIEDIRLRYQTKNYFCHLFPIRRWCA